MSCSNTSNSSAIPVAYEPCLELYFAGIDKKLDELIRKEQVNQLWKLDVESTLHSIWSKECYQRACVSTTCQTDEQLVEDSDTLLESPVNLNEARQTAQEEENNFSSGSNEDDELYPEELHSIVEDIPCSSSSDYENEMSTSDASPEQTSRRTNNCKESRSEQMKSYKCNHCEAKFSRKVSLTKHLHCCSAQQKENVLLDDTSQTLQEEENSFSSDAEADSDINYEEQQDVVEVITSSSSSDYENEMPASSEKTSRRANNCKKSRSRQQKLYQCSHCECKFACKDEMLLHERTHVSVKCQNCARVFTTNAYLIKHLRFCSTQQQENALLDETESEISSEDEKSLRKRTHRKSSWKCVFCSGIFTSSSTLSIHSRLCLLQNLHETGSFECTQCERSFSTREKLKLHSQYQHEERKHKCAVCDKAYTKKSTLTNHMATHTDAKSFPCEFCQKSFGRRDQLGAHIRMAHTKEQAALYFEKLKAQSQSQKAKEFKCAFCDKVFARRSQLSAHVIAHSDARPFCCKYCHKGFKTSSNLGQHIRGYHRKTT